MCRHGCHQGLAEQVRMPVGGERVDDVIGGYRYINPSLSQLFKTRHTTPGMLVGTTLDMHLGGGEANDVDAGLPYLVNDADAMVRFQHIEGAEMAECHPSLHTASDRLLGDVVTSETSWIIAGVGMEVKRHTGGLGGVETPVDMTVLILIHIGTTAQD